MVQPLVNANRLKQITQFVEDDELQGFKLWGVTRLEMVTLRFNYNMNLLQLVCFEEATKILKYMTQVLDGDDETKIQMSKHRDAHMGSQAIHLAATTGNRQIIETVLQAYYADMHETTLGRQTVHHCAA